MLPIGASVLLLFLSLENCAHPRRVSVSGSPPRFYSAPDVSYVDAAISFINDRLYKIRSKSHVYINVFCCFCCREFGDDLQRGWQHRGVALQPHLPPQGTVPHNLPKLNGQFRTILLILFWALLFTPIQKDTHLVWKCIYFIACIVHKLYLYGTVCIYLIYTLAKIAKLH